MFRSVGMVRRNGRAELRPLIMRGSTSYLATGNVINLLLCSIQQVLYLHIEKRKSSIILHGNQRYIFVSNNIADYIPTMRIDQKFPSISLETIGRHRSHLCISRGQSRLPRISAGSLHACQDSFPRKSGVSSTPPSLHHRELLTPRQI